MKTITSSIFKFSKINSSSVKYEENDKILYIHFSQDVFFYVYFLIGTVLCLIILLVDTSALARLSLVGLLISLYLLILFFVLPKSVYIEVHKSTNDILFCTSYFFNKEKKTLMRHIESIKISNDEFDDFISFHATDSVYKLSFGISLTENKLVGLRISEYLGIKIMK